MLEDKKKKKDRQHAQGKENILEMLGKGHSKTLPWKSLPSTPVVIAAPSFDLSSLQIFSVLQVVSIRRKKSMRQPRVCG